MIIANFFSIKKPSLYFLRKSKKLIALISSVHALYIRYTLRTVANTENPGVHLIENGQYLSHWHPSKSFQSRTMPNIYPTPLYVNPYVLNWREGGEKILIGGKMLKG